MLDKVESVKLLRPQKGDIIFIKVQNQEANVLEDLVSHFKELFKHLGNDVKLVVLGSNIEIEVVRKGDNQMANKEKLGNYLFPSPVLRQAIKQLAEIEHMLVGYGGDTDKLMLEAKYLAGTTTMNLRQAIEDVIAKDKKSRPQPVGLLGGLNES